MWRSVCFHGLCPERVHSSSRSESCPEIWSVLTFLILFFSSRVWPTGEESVEAIGMAFLQTELLNASLFCSLAGCLLLSVLLLVLSDECLTSFETARYQKYSQKPVTGTRRDINCYRDIWRTFTLKLRIFECFMAEESLSGSEFDNNQLMYVKVSLYL